MRLTIKNYGSLIGISVLGKWDLIEVDELEHAYAFWFEGILSGKANMKPIILNRDGKKDWDSVGKKSIWTYRITDGGSVTADWFTPQNAISIFESVLV